MPSRNSVRSCFRTAYYIDTPQALFANQLDANSRGSWRIAYALADILVNHACLHCMYGGCAQGGGGNARPAIPACLRLRRRKRRCRRVCRTRRGCLRLQGIVFSQLLACHEVSCCCSDDSWVSCPCVHGNNGVPSTQPTSLLMATRSPPRSAPLLASL
jgi:hypothetical protein